ncbi:hypothetical protein KKE60_08220 [Patescibacteria group bacterium]|nr:hypothetical protein [Patescibacteria group bacterium]
MEKLTCYKIKRGKQTKIPNKECLSQKNIDKYLDRGFTITKVLEKGNKTEIVTFSPKTYSAGRSDVIKRIKLGKDEEVGLRSIYRNIE